VQRRCVCKCNSWMPLGKVVKRRQIRVTVGPSFNQGVGGSIPALVDVKVKVSFICQFSICANIQKIEIAFLFCPT